MRPSPRRILITGATGLIGSHLVRSLVNRGDSVVATSRRPVTIPGATTVQWDPTVETLAAAAYEGCDAVINLAGAPVGTRRWTQREKERIRSSRLAVTSQLAEIVRSTRIPIFLSASAVGYYGPHGDEEIEESAGQGTGFRAEVCGQWEQAASTATESGARVVLLRTGSVLADGGPFMKRLTLFSAFYGCSIGSGNQWAPWIHIDDVVGIILMTLDTPTIAGPVNVTSPNPVTQRQLSTAICHARNRPALLRVPAVLMRIAFGEAATLILSSQRVIPTVALSAAYDFRYSHVGSAVQNLVGVPQ
jgi:uncharacterized protein (TIGR01777 family)